MAPKKPETHDFKFYTLNVKLRNVNSKEDVNIAEYITLFTKLYERKIHKQSSANKHCIIKFLNQEFDDNGKVQFLTGILVQFTFIEGKSWINLQDLDADTMFKIPENIFPDPVQTEFVFVPQAHRFSFRITTAANLRPSPIAKFLEAALNEVATKNQVVQVDIETDKATLSKIENAKSIKKLKIKINYSNFDIGADFKQFVDDQNRKSNLKELEITATPKKGTSIDLTDAIILKGALDNTVSNGVAEATIINDDNKREKINTLDYPILMRVTGTLTRFPHLVYNKIMQHFRSGNGN